MLLPPSKNLSPLEAERLQDTPQLPRCFAFPSAPLPSALSLPLYPGVSPSQRETEPPDSYSISPSLRATTPFVEISAHLRHPRHGCVPGQSPPLRLSSAPVIPFSPFVVEEVHLDVQVLADGQSQVMERRRGPARDSDGVESAPQAAPETTTRVPEYGREETQPGRFGGEAMADKREQPVRGESAQREGAVTPRESVQCGQGGRSSVGAADVSWESVGDLETDLSALSQVPHSALHSPPAGKSAPGSGRPAHWPGGPGAGRDLESPWAGPGAPSGPASGEPRSIPTGTAGKRRHGMERHRRETGKKSVAQVAAELLDFDPQILHHYPMLANEQARIYQFVQRRFIRKVDGSRPDSQRSLVDTRGWPIGTPHPATRSGSAHGRSGISRGIPNAISLPNLSQAASVLAALGAQRLSGRHGLPRQSSGDSGPGTGGGWGKPGVSPSGDVSSLLQAGRGGDQSEPGIEEQRVGESEDRVSGLVGNPRAARSEYHVVEGLAMHVASSSSSHLSSLSIFAHQGGVPGQKPRDDGGGGNASSCETMCGVEVRTCLSEVSGQHSFGRSIEGTDRDEGHVSFLSTSAIPSPVLEADSHAEQPEGDAQIQESAEVEARGFGAEERAFEVQGERRGNEKEDSAPHASLFPVFPARTEKKLLPPLRLGVVVGGLAPSSGVHNVIVGLSHFLRDFTRPIPDCACKRGFANGESREGAAGTLGQALPSPKSSRARGAPQPQTPIRLSTSEPSNLAVRGGAEEGGHAEGEEPGQTRAREELFSGASGDSVKPTSLRLDSCHTNTPSHAAAFASTLASSSVRGEGEWRRGTGEGRGLQRCSKLIGFLDGALGLAKDESVELTEDIVANFLNMGGCELLGYRGFKSLTDFSISRIQQVCEKHGLHGLVIVGGAEDLQAATQLAHRFLQEGLRTRVVAVPHSARGDLHCEEFLPITLGFDSARSMLSEFCGNIALDSSSSKKYYHFIRCSSSNLTLECALQTRPTMCLTGLECDIEGWSLERIIEAICDVIVKRRKLLGKRSGTILLSEELVENLPEMKELRDTIHDLLQVDSATSSSLLAACAAPSDNTAATHAWAIQPPTEASLCALLPERLARAFRLLPAYARRSLMLQHDCRGRPLLPTIEAEALLAQRVEKELRKRKAAGDARCVETFTYRLHYLGQEGRCPLPTRFDCTLGYALGTVAGAIVSFGLTGYMACVRNVHLPLDCWEACALPLVCLLRPSSRVRSAPSASSSKPSASSAGPAGPSMGAPSTGASSSEAAELFVSLPSGTALASCEGGETPWPAACGSALSPAFGRWTEDAKARGGPRAVAEPKGRTAVGGEDEDMEESLRRKRQMLLSTEVHDESIPLMLVAQFCSPLETLLRVQPLKLKKSKFTELLASPEFGGASTGAATRRGLLQLASDPSWSRTRSSEPTNADFNLSKDSSPRPHPPGEEGRRGDGFTVTSSEAGADPRTDSREGEGTQGPRAGDREGPAATRTETTKTMEDQGEDMFFGAEAELLEDAWTDSEAEHAEERLSSFQIRRLEYKPKLPAVFFQPFTLACMDITAVISSNPVLLQRVFPLTHNLRAIDVVPMKQLLEADPWTPAPLPPSSCLLRFWRSPVSRDSSSSPAALPPPCLPYHLKRAAKRANAGVKDACDVPAGVACCGGGERAAGQADCGEEDRQISGGEASVTRVGAAERREEREKEGKAVRDEPAREERERDDCGDFEGAQKRGDERQHGEGHRRFGEAKPSQSEGSENRKRECPLEQPVFARPLSPTPGHAADALRSAAASPRRCVNYEGHMDAFRRTEEKKLAPPPQFVGVHRGGLALRADADLGEALQFDTHETANSAAPFFANPLGPLPGSSVYPAPLLPVSLEAEKPRRVSPYPAALPSAPFGASKMPGGPQPLSETRGGLEGSPRKPGAETGNHPLPESIPLGTSGTRAPAGSRGRAGGCVEGSVPIFERPTAGPGEPPRFGSETAAGEAGAWRHAVGPPGPATMARIISPSLVAVPATETFGRLSAKTFGTPRSRRGTGEGATGRDEGEEKERAGGCACGEGGGETDSGTAKQATVSKSRASWKGEGGSTTEPDTGHLRLHPLGLIRAASAPQRDFPKVEEEETFQPSHCISSHSTADPSVAMRRGPHSARSSHEGPLAGSGAAAPSPPLRGPTASDGAQVARPPVPIGSALFSDLAPGSHDEHALPPPGDAWKARSWSDPSETASAVAKEGNPHHRRSIKAEAGKDPNAPQTSETQRGESAGTELSAEGERPERSAGVGEKRWSPHTSLAARVRFPSFVASLLRDDGEQRGGRNAVEGTAASGLVRRSTRIDLQGSASPVVMLRYESGRADTNSRLERGDSAKTRFALDEVCQGRRPTTEGRCRSLSPFRDPKEPSGLDAGNQPPWRLEGDSEERGAPLSRSGPSVDGKKPVPPCAEYFSSSSFASAASAEAEELRGGEGDSNEAAPRDSVQEGDRSEREHAERREGRGEREGKTEEADARGTPQSTKADEGYIEPKLCLSRKSSRINLVESQEPLRIAVCFFGRQAPGGLNAVMGVLEYLENLSPKGICIGILGGILGLVHGWYTIVDRRSFSLFRNQGGLDLLCRTTEHFINEFELQQCIKTIQALRLDGLVVLGGTSAVSDAAILTEHLLDSDTQTCVVGVPMTVDNGVPFIEACLGHDTVCRVFNSIIGSLMHESRSSKCWYFIRVSGKCLSHLAAECALDTHPNLVLINEEIEQKRMGAMALTNLISDIVETRAGLGLHYGTVLLPDSLLAHLPEMHMLINEVDACFESGFYAQTEEGLELLRARLTPWSAALFSSLPKAIQWQLAFNKDQTYRVDLTAIDTEVLLKRLVERELARRKSIGAFRKGQFLCKTHFLAYQGRSAAPTIFDADLGFSYGYTAAVLVDGGCTGYMAQISNLVGQPSEWSVSAVPFTCLVDVQPVKPSTVTPLHHKVAQLRHSHLHQHGRHVWSPAQASPATHATHYCGPASGRAGCSASGHTSEESLKFERDTRGPSSSSSSAVVLMFRVEVPLQKLSLQGGMFRTLALSRAEWALGDCFSNPGPVQYEGAASRVRLNSLRLPSTDPTVKLKKISQLCSQVKSLCSVMATPPLLKTAESSLHSIVEVLSTLSRSERNQQMQFYDISHVLAQRCTTKAWLSAAESLPLSNWPSSLPASFPGAGHPDRCGPGGPPAGSCFLASSPSPFQDWCQFSVSPPASSAASAVLSTGAGLEAWTPAANSAGVLSAGPFDVFRRHERTSSEKGREPHVGQEAAEGLHAELERHHGCREQRPGSLVSLAMLSARPSRTRVGRREWAEGDSEETGRAFFAQETGAAGAGAVEPSRLGEEEMETLWSGEAHAGTRRLPSFSLVCLNKASGSL
ncbi:UNVERIFIED_CONTAM: phosphofructokinase domain-containing protein [Hammondia hammondi]|eukprot:XP_008887625.1 phosphofructokinase domain-containing protein [Hammondia hammondi]